MKEVVTNENKDGKHLNDSKENEQRKKKENGRQMKRRDRNYTKLRTGTLFWKTLKNLSLITTFKM